MEQIKQKEIRVSDHALLRYLERNLGLNFSETKKKILTQKLTLAIEKLGDGEFPLMDGTQMVAVVRNRTIVTIKEYIPKKKLIKKIKHE